MPGRIPPTSLAEIPPAPLLLADLPITYFPIT